MGFRWDTDPEAAFEGLMADYQRRVHQAVLAVLSLFAPQIEGWMKDNAPWTDHTGNARQSLYVEVEDLIHEVALMLDYGVDYGRFLELKHAGRFAIIGPAVDTFAPQILEALRGLLA